MPNRFRDPIMRGQYDAMVHAYRTKHKDLIRPNGDRHRGNSAAAAFWRGYDGTRAGKWDAASKRLIIYACWCAGRDISKEEEAGPRKKEAGGSEPPTPAP